MSASRRRVPSSDQRAHLGPKPTQQQGLPQYAPRQSIGQSGVLDQLTILGLHLVSRGLDQFHRELLVVCEARHRRFRETVLSRAP